MSTFGGNNLNFQIEIGARDDTEGTLNGTLRRVRRRCARRVLAALVARWGDASNAAGRACERIIQTVENEGAGIEPGMPLSEACDFALKVVECAGRDATDESGKSAILAGQVADFGEVIVYALRTAMETDAGRSATHAANAALKARQVIGVDTAGRDDKSSCQAALAAIRGDFDLLNQASTQLGWTDGTCIPQAWFDSKDECGNDTDAAQGR